MESETNRAKEIVYSCSGCSTAAQMANYIAVKLDRSGIIEMSCIAGVGGGVKALVNTAKSATKIVALDGCQLRCVEHCLAQHGIEANEHIILSDFEVRKLKHQDFDVTQAERVFEIVKAKIEGMKTSSQKK